MAPDIVKFSSQGEGPVTRPTDGDVTMRLDAIFDASPSLHHSLNQPRLLHVLYPGNLSLELCGALTDGRWSLLAGGSQLALPFRVRSLPTIV